MGLPSRSILVNLVSNLLLFPLLPLFLLWFGINGAGWHAVVQAAVATAGVAFLFRSSARRIA